MKYKLVMEVEFEHGEAYKALALELYTKLKTWFSNHLTKPKITVFELEEMDYPEINIEKI